ncbi:transcription initiation factor TFIID subunit 9B [Gracilinanus agilis]|uniref:transcription initiation factor TFIID subunit 9B n=1 Tax=Gracilinanus agilis TaxID=191870 RepID=UPI001CFC766C|nr:transcription initiation factor TFIID subunit 9B [Gracilinanus agilis]
MAQILKDMGITDYEPKVINQMLEFAFRYVTTILDDAKIYSSHAKKATVDADDVRLAIQCRSDQSFTSPPPRDGPAPAGRITVPRLSVGAVSSRPSTPTLGNPPAQPVAASNKAGAPPASGPPPNQRFAVQMPPSQSAVAKPGNETGAKPAAPAAPAVQNVMINPSLMGQKNILITTNVVSQNTPVESPNALKRKHEDDDDYDNL